MPVILSTEGLEFVSKLRYPDIEIEKKEVAFVSGPSGCGKSTLLKLINNTCSPSAGRIFFDGTDINELDAVELRKKVLLIGQNTYLFKESITDNFETFHEYNESPMPSESEIEGYLKTCCLDFSPESKCDNMSGGERQRVFLSIALSMNPEILMLDEPTSALDHALSMQVMENIIQHCKKNDMTLIVVSHDAALKEKYAEKVIDLERCKQ